MAAIGRKGGQIGGKRRLKTMNWPALEYSPRQAAKEGYPSEPGLRDKRDDRKEITAVNPTTGQRIRLHGQHWVDYYTGVRL
jgi:hypothetical protein